MAPFFSLHKSCICLFCGRGCNRCKLHSVFSAGHVDKHYKWNNYISLSHAGSRYTGCKDLCVFREDMQCNPGICSSVFHEGRVHTKRNLVEVFHGDNRSICGNPASLDHEDNRYKTCKIDVPSRADKHCTLGIHVLACRVDIRHKTCSFFWVVHEGNFCKDCKQTWLCHVCRRCKCGSTGYFCHAHTSQSPDFHRFALWNPLCKPSWVPLDAAANTTGSTVSSLKVVKNC